MRAFFSAIILFISACGQGDCLPEPATDSTPPLLRLVIHYRTASTGEPATFRFALGDSSTSITADARGPLSIIFIAEDSSGVRSLTPGITVQNTVGIGVEQQRIPMEAATASCPVPSLRVDREITGTGDARVLIVSAAATNWLGVAAAIEPVSVRLE